MSATPPEELQELARSYGVQLEYKDMAGKIKSASTDSLLAILKVLGADLDSEADAPEALRQRKLDRWKRGVEPVVVSWMEDGDGSVEVHLPQTLAGTEFTCRLESESGTILEWSTTVKQPIATEVEDQNYLTFAVTLPPGLTSGYYQFLVRIDEVEDFARTLVIRAPRRAYQASIGTGKRPWGVFCPLYALHGEKSWGAGDFSDLEALIDWTAAQGGGMVATLPMLASNFDGPVPVISPYSPTSRLFWNEFYLDLDRIMQTAECPEAQALFARTSGVENGTETTADERLGEFTDRLRSGDLVDYGAQMWLKRTILEKESAFFFDHEGLRDESFLGYLAEHPEVRDYAAFQAAGENHGRDWRRWPTDALNLSKTHAESTNYGYHLYVQWKTDQQLQALSAKVKNHGLTWYLDFPIGVDHNSFDVWKNRQIFATGASVGCPPDPVFTKGQNWGFPPAHPDRQRESGYAYFIGSIRNHLRYANALRIDHVMGLHRLFWIPSGAEAKDGAFVSTPAEEIYAILSVESHRHQAWLVGEDLGTVPPEVDRAMKQHNVRGMYVIQYEIRADEKQPLRDVPESTVASVNTHDMPPFASFWSGADLDDRFDLGLLDEAGLTAERLVRRDQCQALVRFLVQEKRLEPGDLEPRSILKAVHDWLAASDSSVLLLNLEDLWLETRPQNTPNTYLERPNWRRKLRKTFEEFSTDPGVLELIQSVNQIRSGTTE